MSREQWHHVAATHDGANAILFVDGHEALRHPESSDQGDITFFRLGGKHDSHFLGGIVDEIKIYNRAKTAEEIAKDAAP